MEKLHARDSAGLETERRRPDDEVAHLLGQIMRLVAEERRLEGARSANRVKPTTARSTACMSDSRSPWKRELRR
jgi:hypothetical protein